jgi:hypothetical protein
LFAITAFLAGCQRHRHRSALDGIGRYRGLLVPAPAPTGQTGINRPDRHQPARPAPTGQTGTNRPDRRKAGTDLPGLFYGVIDTHFLLNGPKRYDTKNKIIK